MEQNIEVYRHDLDIIRETADQVIRDFGLYNISITFSGNPYTAYDELRQQLAPALRNLSETSRVSLKSLLYRIDVFENEFSQITVNQSKESYFDALAEIILRRELIKVVHRKLFKLRNG